CLERRRCAPCWRIRRLHFFPPGHPVRRATNEVRRRLRRARLRRRLSAALAAPALLGSSRAPTAPVACSGFDLFSTSAPACCCALSAERSSCCDASASSTTSGSMDVSATVAPTSTAAPAICCPVAPVDERPLPPPPAEEGKGSQRN